MHFLLLFLFVLFSFPLQVTELGVSHDGQFLFTAGGEDCTVHMWRVNVRCAMRVRLLFAKHFHVAKGVCVCVLKHSNL